MSCDASYYIRRIQTDIRELGDDICRSFEKQAKKIDAQRINMPDVAASFKNSDEKERYTALDDTTSLYFRRVDKTMLRMYEIDFGLSMVTISTIQGSTVTASETKKLSEMPPKMVQKAQSCLPATSIHHNKTSGRHVKRR